MNIKNKEDFKTHNDYDTLDLIINKLKQHKENDRFYYVRYGDGDIIMMYPESEGLIIGRSNKFLVTKELQQELCNAWMRDLKCIVELKS